MNFQHSIQTKKLGKAKFVLVGMNGLGAVFKDTNLPAQLQRHGPTSTPAMSIKLATTLYSLMRYKVTGDYTNYGSRNHSTKQSLLSQSCFLFIFSFLKMNFQHSIQTKKLGKAKFVLVGMNGLEPSTPTLSGWCSNQLSYIPLFL